VLQSAGTVERGPVVSATVIVCALALLTLSVFANAPVQVLGPVLLVLILLTAAARTLLAWKAQLALVAIVILFIPIRRYSLPGQLPFQVEPYRLLIALIVAGWISSLLIDPRVRLRRTGLEGPIGLCLVGVLGSLAFNVRRFQSVETYSLKQVSFFISFLFMLYVVASVARSMVVIDFLVKVLVAAGSVVAVAAIWEARTGYNVFNHLTTLMPFLRMEAIPWVGQDGRGERAYASAQHAIPLGAALALLLPLAIYVVKKTDRRLWWACAASLAIGSVGTYSRTSVLMLLVMLLVYVKMRPVQMRRCWPALIPALLVLHFAIPGSLGTIKNSFFPEGGLIAQQDADAGTAGSGRLADLGPGLDEWVQRPFFGQGFGTRIVEGPQANSNILDDQWLGTLLETGIVGFAGWSWLFIRLARRLGRAAKEDDSPQGWLLVGLAASISAYAVSMFTYDAFSFIQVTFLLFFMMGFAAILTEKRREPRLRVVVFAAPHLQAD
jgi:polysaccharide biosynthesis protein PslJ